MTSTLLRAAAAVGTPAHDALRAKAIATDVSWGGPATRWEGVLAELLGNEKAGAAVAAKNAVLTPAQAA